MKLLVTGGAGFIGSHLTEALIARGHDVTVVDSLSTGFLSNLSKDVRLVRADVQESLGSVMLEMRPEVVLHLAAQVSVAKSVIDPVSDLRTNVGGVVNVMEAAGRAGVRKVIAVSSAAVYGVPAELPLTPTSPTRPISPYGLSKLAGEQYVRLLSAQTGVAYTLFRPANVYGPRQLAEGDGAVIPAFLSRFFAGRDPVIHGDGSQTRDFVFVSDMVQAFIQALTRADGMTLHISSGVGTSIQHLWEMAAKLLSWPRPAVYGPVRAGDIPHSIMVNREAVSVLEWQPQVALADGLMRTIGWMREQQAAVGLDVS